MTGIATYARNVILDAIFNDAALQIPARYVQLHTGDPGASGTANAAVNASRKSLTGAPSVNGVFTNVNSLQWTAVPAAETYTHASTWDAPTGGNCLWTGTLGQAQAVNVGDSFTVAPGDLVVSVT